MKKIRAAVVSYNNIGHYAVQALKAAEDPKITGIVRHRGAENKPAELVVYEVVKDIKELTDVDVAILATPTRSCKEHTQQTLPLDINTMGSFDIHTNIADYRVALVPLYKQHHAVSITSTGWNPGSDSIVRTLMQNLTSKGFSYTNFGPSMSMGHSIYARGKKGVKNTPSVTTPLGEGIHRRMVYVELEDDATLDEATKETKADPYFAHDETHVMAVKSVDMVRDMGHDVHLVHKGVSGNTQSQRMEFSTSVSNLALTAQILASVTRASIRQQPGCYTMVKLPTIGMLPGERGGLIKHLV